MIENRLIYMGSHISLNLVFHDNLLFNSNIKNKIRLKMLFLTNPFHN